MTSTTKEFGDGMTTRRSRGFHGKQVDLTLGKNRSRFKGVTKRSSFTGPVEEWKILCAGTQLCFLVCFCFNRFQAMFVENPEYTSTFTSFREPVWPSGKALGW